MFHHPIHLPAILLLLQRLTLVVLLLTLAEGDIHLGATFVVDEYQRGHDGVTRLLGGTLEGANLFLRQQQFAIALHLVVVVRSVEVRTYTHALHPQLTIDHSAVGVYQTGLTQSDTLNLCTREHNACRVGFDEEVLKRGLLVLNLYRALLPELFLCLIQFSIFNLL